jgi:hypothetical protein
MVDNFVKVKEWRKKGQNFELESADVWMNPSRVVTKEALLGSIQGGGSVELWACEYEQGRARYFEGAVP